MDIRFLSTFIEVSETRHFGRAAENLYLTQAAVSARIKLLEEFFNTKLFIRNRNSIQLTPAGERLLPYARRLSETLLEAQNNVTGNDVNFLNISASHCAYDLFLEGRLVSLMGDIPALHIRSEIVNNETLIRQLLEHSIDVGFSTELLKSDDVEHVAVWESGLSIYASQGGIDLYDIDNPVVTLFVDYSPRVNERILKHLAHLRNPNLRTTSPRLSLQEITATGHLSKVTVLPDKWVGKQHNTATSIHKVGELNIEPLTIYACYRKNSVIKEVNTIIEYFTT